jgi:hypothetical protein
VFTIRKVVPAFFGEKVNKKKNELIDELKRDKHILEKIVPFFIDEKFKIEKK